MLVNNKGLSSRKRPWQCLRPDFLTDSVAEIDFTYLQHAGVRAVFIDLDGTVVARGSFKVPAKTRRALRVQPLAVYIATNRPKSRDLKNLKNDLHASGVIHPSGIWAKPTRRYYRSALRTLKLQPQEVAMVGDRYVQDVLGANGAGLRTVMVQKFDTPVNWFDRLLTSAEARRNSRLSRRYHQIDRKT